MRDPPRKSERERCRQVEERIFSGRRIRVDGGRVFLLMAGWGTHHGGIKLSGNSQRTLKIDLSRRGLLKKTGRKRRNEALTAGPPPPKLHGCDLSGLLDRAPAPPLRSPNHSHLLSFLFFCLPA